MTTNKPAGALPYTLKECESELLDLVCRNYKLKIPARYFDLKDKYSEAIAVLTKRGLIKIEYYTKASAKMEVLYPSQLAYIYWGHDVLDVEAKKVKEYLFVLFNSIQCKYAVIKVLAKSPSAAMLDCSTQIGETTANPAFWVNYNFIALC